MSDHRDFGPCVNAGSSYRLVGGHFAVGHLDGHSTIGSIRARGTSKNAPMVNDPLRIQPSSNFHAQRFVGKPYTVSEMNHPFPNQYACEGIPILAAYAGFQGWDGIVWYSFEQKKDPNWQPYVGDPFDMSLDPVKMPQIAAGALMFVRGDLDAAKQTVERSYTTQQVWDSRFLTKTERPYFTPGFPAYLPLLHGSRIKALDGDPTAAVSEDRRQSVQKRYGTVGLVHQPGGQPDANGPGDNRQPAIAGADRIREGQRQERDEPRRRREKRFFADRRQLAGRQTDPNCGKMLLTACVRVENTGMTWDATRTHTSRQGRSPSLIEPVTGRIILRSLDSAAAVSATPLDGSGRALGEPIVAAKTMRGWEISVGDPATTWYLVTVSR